MLVALDVGYTTTPHGDHGQVGVVAFNAWTSGSAAHELVVPVANVDPYVSGRLFERELPCLIAGLDKLGEVIPDQVSVVVVDGNVRLDQQDSPGLGMYLWRHLGEQIPVVGVAKNEYAGLQAIEVTRGESTRPIYVTAAGMPEADAADHVRSMAGDFRLPTLLRRADQLTRSTA